MTSLTAEELHRLSGLVEKLGGGSVMCVGDVMLDHFVYGDVSRISPEGPVPVLKIDRETSMLGGVGNCIRNLSRLGTQVRAYSVVGTDAAATDILRLLEQCDECVVSMEQETGRKTTVKTRFIAQGQQMMRVDVENSHAIQSETLQSLIQRFEADLPHCSVVLLSDYAKGVLSGDMPQQLIQLAMRVGIPVVVDPKGRDYRRYRGATLIKPNLRELAEVTGLSIANNRDIEAAARQLLAVCECAYLLVTRGAAGMMLVSQTGGTLHLPATAREVFDVSGAGDTVAAALAAGLAGGLPMDDAARLANIAAGVVVSKLGTATVDRSEILKELHHQGLSDLSNKVSSLEDACERVRLWRSLGFKVGFTNGCFDLLHPGHVSLLHQARLRCDRLIVGVNSDASVRRLKGMGRPVQDELARSLVLASLQFVDLAVVFDELTPKELILNLRPDLLVKGADYKPEQVVGSDIIRSWGGELYLAEVVPDRSTSATVDAVRSRNG